VNNGRINMTLDRARLYGDTPITDIEGELSPSKFAAIGLLLAGRPYADVAREVGIDVMTLNGWRQEPAFVAELCSQFELMREATLCGLFSMAAESINALRSALKSQNETARVAAAQTVLDRLGIRETPVSPKNESMSTTRAPTDGELVMRMRHEVLRESQDVDEHEIVRRVRAILASM
jgi:hypothetical protein